MHTLITLAIFLSFLYFSQASVKKHIKNNPAGALFTGISGKEITKPGKVAKALSKGSDVVFVSSPKKAPTLNANLQALKYHSYMLHKVLIASKTPLKEEKGVLVYTHQNGRKIVLAVGNQTEAEMLKTAEMLSPQDPDYVVFRRKNLKERFLHATHLKVNSEETKIGKGTVTLHLLEFAKVPDPTKRLQTGEASLIKTIIWILLAVATPTFVVVAAVLLLRARAHKAESANL